MVEILVIVELIGFDLLTRRDDSRVVRNRPLKDRCAGQKHQLLQDNRPYELLFLSHSYLVIHLLSNGSSQAPGTEA